MNMHTHKQSGFSLVELMVAITLSMILMAGVLSIFFSSKVTYFANEKTARLQEDGRMALDLIVRDIRSAGYGGCARAVPFTSTLNSSTSLIWNYSVPMQGFESTGATSWSPALDTVSIPSALGGNDVLVLRVAQREGRAVSVTADLAGATSDPTVVNTNPAPVAAGQIMMITDCNASAVFQVRGYAAGAVQHGAGGSNPGNASNDLGYVYQAGARLIPLQTVIYYLRNSASGSGPALWRRVGNAAPEELIEGVQGLQIVYGEDTDNDRLVNQYVSASAVANWNNVMSVSVALLIRSEANGTDVDSQSYNLLGTNLGPFNDRRQRMLFTTTAALRNRAI